MLIEVFSNKSMRQIYNTDSGFICNIDAPCFMVLSTEEKELVRSSRVQLVFRKGDVMCKQGAFANNSLFLIKGFAKQYIESDSDKNFNLRIMSEGDFIGLSSVFSSAIFNYSVMALEECQAVMIESNALTGLATQNGQFALNLIKRYHEENNILYKLLLSSYSRQMNGKMAEKLLYLDEFRSAIPDIFVALSRRDLAEFTGVSVESAIKLLKSFEKDGLINLKGKDIVVSNREKLELISKAG